MPRNSVVRVKSRKKSIHCCLNACCKSGLPVSSLPSSSIEPSSMAKSPPKPCSLDTTKSSSSSSSSSSNPNSSVSSCSQQALQDILYEYVKGLQDAIKVPDPELAERLLVEIGSALSLPSAVSLVISANGARLIASCVKHFRWYALSKPSSTTTTTTNEPEPEPGGGSMDDVLDPTTMDEVLAIPAESRRKRQRTAGELEEEEDMQSAYENRWGKPRKPVKLKGRSLKVGNSRKVGSEVVEAGNSSVEAENSSVEDKKSDTVPERGKCWATECPLKIDPGVVSELAGKELEVKSLMDKPDSEESSGSMAEDEGDGVYSLAKSSGMSNVVATACSALDKLLNAALQAKKSKAGNTGNGKRGKSLSAEMYVALTEAFVDMVHVLKDNVDLLSWCLNCLGSILPPGSLERASFEGSSSFSNVAPLKEPAMSDEDGSKSENSDGYSKQYQPHPAETLLDSKLFPSKALLKLAAKYRDHSTSTDFTLKIGSKSTSGSYVAAARSFTSGKGGKGSVQSSFYSGITSESTSGSISALAAVAYAATVPMLAEKAVKAVLSAMQSCDIEAHSTLAALRALGAHLSSTNSKSVCDDAFMFIIAAMREFVDNAEMQAESCLALGSLTRAVSSTTGHAAWSAITTSMEHHGTNLAVQRAGCAALQILCTRTGLGIPEWRTGKRPLRASKDGDREVGARALISSMSAFPNDVRIQWHGCSTLWTLVHSAGVKSVGNIVKAGAVTAVVGAMSVCRMNEMMQQEGCNVIGTMVRTLAENGHDVGLFSSSSRGEGCEGDGMDGNDEDISSSTDWWAALGAVVSAMKTFSKSRPLQSNGTFALGCILKGSGETVNFGSACVSSLGKPVPTEDTRNDSLETGDTALLTDFPGKDIVDNVEKISAAVEVTTAAMEEFSKVETVQVWGCAVLQQAFLAYVHYAKCLGPVSEACKLKSPLFSQSDQTVPKNGECGETVRVPSPSDSLAKFILSQATLAMYMISRTMANSYSDSSTSQGNQTKSNPVSVQRGKPNFGPRAQNSTLSIFFSSVRQSWCAALGAIGDVFGYLTRNSEVGKGFTTSECIDFFRSNKSLFDRSSFDQSLHMDTRSCCDSESEDAQSERSSLDTEESEKRRSQSCSESNMKCATSSWIDWTGFGTTQQQAVKDIKAWQEVTESMARIAEEVGFPLSVKNAILSIRTIFYKLDDAETVIWACHALVSLYLTWENLHLFKPEAEIDRDEYKAKIWGEGEAGVRQLVDLVVHWTNQNRLDVTSLALQALYGACVFAATIQEIDKVFSFGGCGPEAVLGAMQKALLSGNAQHRRKVVQPACCVLATVCGYSVRAQVNIAVHGGADLILTALDRYNEDNQVQLNGLHALGIDSHAQPDFDAIWNSAISRTAPGKSARRRRGSQSSSSVVGLTHIFREGVNCSSFRDGLSMEESASLLKGKWNTCFERLVLQGTAHVGLFKTALIAAPGCGGPPFAIEVLRKLGTATNSSEMQAHLCFVIGCMSEHNAAWRTNLLNAGALQSVLRCMSSMCSWKHTDFTGFTVLRDGAEVEIPAEVEDSNNTMDAALCGVDSRIQCAAAWAIAGLVKDGATVPCSIINSIVQALVVALHRYGGLSSVPSPETHAKKPQAEVCAPARLALARLGVVRLATRSQVVHMVHEAAQTGDIMCLKALADAGIDLFVTDSDGKNGECYARSFNQSQAAQFFKDQVQKKKAREKAKAKNKQNSFKKVAEETAVIKEQDTVLQAVIEEAVTSKVTGTVSATPAVSFTPTTESTVTEISTTDESVAQTLQEDKKQKNKKSKKKTGKREEVNEVSAVSNEQQLNIDQLNTSLREAMASGEVEKMEAALKGCEHDAHLVDERLLKQVKGALAKRLKRREKAGLLEDELTAAMEEGSHSRLQAVILAIEQAPRFAAALQEKILTAKSQLHEIETQLQKEEQIESSTKCIEEELLEETDGSWTVSHQKSRRKKDKENVEIPVQVPVETPSTKTKNKTLRPRKQKNNTRQNNSPQVAALNVDTVNNNSIQPQVQSFSESSWYRLPLAPGQDLPPLLPTPRSSLRSPVQPRSVIMPPRAATSCEHNPITPQLFPSTRSPLVSDLGDYTEHSQMMMLPSTWSSPRSCSSLEDRPQSSSSSRWGAWPGSRSSTPENYGYEPAPAWSDSVTNPDSQGYVATLLSTLFPVERVPSSSTSSLFSASLGEFPAPARLSSPSGLSTSHCAAGNDDSDILSFLDSTLRRNGAYGLEDEPWEKEEALFGSSVKPMGSIRQPHRVGVKADYNLFGTTQQPDGGSLFSDYRTGAIHRQHQQAVRSAEYCSDRNGKMAQPGSLFSGYRLGEQEQVGEAQSGDERTGMIHNNSDRDQHSRKQWRTGEAETDIQDKLEKPGGDTDKLTKLGDCIQTSGGCTTGNVQTHSVNCSSPWLQAALIEATLEDCCCICFDMPKDAALVPCGHRMCKNCAEQVRCIRESCPICNKYIDAVLALYG